DEKNQILTTNCWLTQRWRDVHLTWNASEFDDIRVIRLPYMAVWKPDIILYNNADSLYNWAVINTNVIVDNDGNVTWLSHGIYRSACDIDVQYFPFDVQTCRMKWASWTYDGYQVDIVYQQAKGELSNYQNNGEFHLEDFYAIRSVVNYSCCPEPYPDVTYYLQMRRRPLFYVFNLILPCVLITGIALLVFYVPPESGEKVTLGISALLSMTVFLMTIRESLPPTEQTPLISLYYGVTICIVSFATGLSVLTLNLYHRGQRDQSVSPLIRRVVLGWMARLVLFVSTGAAAAYRKNRKLQRAKKAQGSPSNSTTANFRRFYEGPAGDDRTGVTGLDMPMFDLNHHQSSAPEDFGFVSNRQQIGNRKPPSSGGRRGGQFRSSNPTCNSFIPSPPPPPHIPSPAIEINGSASTEGTLVRLLHNMNAAVERNEYRIRQAESSESSKAEWQRVALVCDRFCLLAFFIITVTSTCSGYSVTQVIARAPGIGSEEGSDSSLNLFRRTQLNAFPMRKFPSSFTTT
ncbi:unnamed protein product, partial [Cyprideis torosa]